MVNKVLSEIIKSNWKQNIRILPEEADIHVTEKNSS